MRYSLKQLMALTGVVAVIAAAASMLAPLVATFNALAFGIGIALCLGTLALVAVFATLRSNPTQGKYLSLALVAVAAAGLVYYGMETTNADPGWVWGLVVMLYTMALTGLLLLARSRGLRLLRTSDIR
jgi:hypothetical protein